MGSRSRGWLWTRKKPCSYTEASERGLQKGMSSWERLLSLLRAEKLEDLAQHRHGAFHNHTPHVSKADVKPWFSEVLCGSVTFLGFLNQQTNIGSESSVLIEFHFFPLQYS